MVPEYDLAIFDWVWHFLATLDSFWTGLNDISPLETHHAVRTRCVQQHDHNRYLLLVQTLPSAEHKTAAAADTTVRRCLTQSEADYVGTMAEAIRNFKRVVSINQTPVSIMPDICDGSFDPRQRKLFVDREYRKGDKHHTHEFSRRLGHRLAPQHFRQITTALILINGNRFPCLMSLPRLNTAKKVRRVLKRSRNILKLLSGMIIRHN
jgi:hypothetical protein